MQSALTHPPGHAYAHPHLPASSFRSPHSGVTSLFGQADEREHGPYDSLAQPQHRQESQNLQLRGPREVRAPGALSPSPPGRTPPAHRAYSYPPNVSSVNATPSSPLSSSSSHPRPSSTGSAGGSSCSGAASGSSPRLYLQQQQQQRQLRESRMVVTTSSTPVQTENVLKMARYSVGSYSPSPDTNESLDKSLNDEDEDDVEDDDEGEEDDEFSDGGHYRGPPPNYRPSEDDRFRFLQAPGNHREGRSGGSPPGGEVDVGGGREAREAGHQDEEEENEEAAVSMERQKRMFFQGYLNGSRQIIYPLRGYPSTSHDFQLYHQQLQPQQQDQQFRYSRDDGTMGEAFDAYAMMRHRHQLLSGQAPVPVQPELSNRYSDASEGQSHEREGQGHGREVKEEVRCKEEPEDGQPQSQSPRRESLPAYGFSPTSAMPPHQGRNGSDTHATATFSPRRNEDSAGAEIKREPDSSPDCEKRPPSGLPPSSAPISSSSMSSPLTKIPIPPSMPPVSPQQTARSEGYPRQLASMREMMITGSMVGHLPQGIMPPSGPQCIMSRLNPRAEGHALGHLYFCHLCQYSGNSKDEFDLHMTIHFEHNCPHCDYTSRTEGRLKRHIKDFHSDPDSKQRTMPGRPKVFKCKQCDFSTTDKIAFWSHARVHIKEDKLLACPQCPFVTEYKHHLEYHLRNHFGSKPHKCGKCNYSCVNKSMLNSHMKSHTNVYQYRCADCTYATKYCHSLKLHLKKYNHKPATVLNSDGSLPLGMDADISGLSLLAKRGPPRGPRGLRKDKEAGESPGMSPGGPGFVPGFPGFPLSPCHPQRGGGGGPGPGPFGQGVPPMINGGMFPGMWPMMPNGMHHPSSLMPPLVGAFGGPMSLDKEGGRETGPVHSLREAPSEGWVRPRAEEGGWGPEGQGPVQCKMCCFTAETSDGLQAHVFKIHASENRDLLNMLPYNLNSETLLDGAETSGQGPPSTPHSFTPQPMSPISKLARRLSAPPQTTGHAGSGFEQGEVRDSVGEEAGTPSRRHTIPTQSPYRSIQIGGQSEAPWLHRRKEMQESVRWPLQGGSYLGRNFEKEGGLEAGPEEAERGADILRQMTRRFGDNMGPALPGAAQPCTMTSDLLLSPSSIAYPSLAAAAMSMAATIAAQATREDTLARAPSGLQDEVTDPGTALDLTRKPSPPTATPPATSPPALRLPATMPRSHCSATTEAVLEAPPVHDQVLPAEKDHQQRQRLPEQQKEGHQKNEQSQQQLPLQQTESPPQQRQHGEKRPLAALEGSSAHSGEENGAGEDGVSQPRKRSRKGKAIKRVRPEHVPMSPDFLASGDHSEQESHSLEELSAPAGEDPTSSPRPFHPSWNARAPVSGVASNAVNRVDASTGPEEEEEEHFKRLQEELQLLNNQNNGIHGSSLRTVFPLSPNRGLTQAPQNIHGEQRFHSPERRRTNSVEREMEVKRGSGPHDEPMDEAFQQSSSPSQQSQRTSGAEHHSPGSGDNSCDSSSGRDESPADPEGQAGDFVHKEEDPEKEREALVKAICQNRRQPPNPAVRRGADLAYKLLLDTVKDPNDPALKALRKEEEKVQMERPGPTATSTMPTTPTSTHSSSIVRHPVDDARPRQHQLQQGHARQPLTSPPMTSSASVMTSPRPGTLDMMRGGGNSAGASGFHLHNNPQHLSPPRHAGLSPVAGGPLAGRLPADPFFGLAAAARMGLKPLCLPERMSAFAQTYPVLQYAEMLAKGVGPALPSHPPPSPHHLQPLPHSPSTQSHHHQPPPPPPLLSHVKSMTTAAASSQPLPSHSHPHPSQHPSSHHQPHLSPAASVGYQNSTHMPGQASASSQSQVQAQAHKYECQFCDLLFKDHLMFSLHMAQHKPGNPFECSCGHVSGDKVEFYLHQLRHPHS